MSLRKLFATSVIFLSVLAAPTLAQQNGAIAKGPQKDPNLPPLSGMIEGPIYWTYGVSTRPGVFFKNPQAEGDYLGFDEKGSVIRNQATGKIYRWNLKEYSLTVVANSLKEIPLSLLTSMQNTDQTVQYLLAQHGMGPKPTPVVPPPPPPNPDKSAGLFGNNPRQALQGLAPAAGTPAAGSPFEIAGKSASVQGGVLTFTLANGSKSQPYTVARPTFMANAPAAGVTGTWIARQENGKGILFNVQADNSVTGKEIQPQVVQMMMQSAPKAH